MKTLIHFSGLLALTGLLSVTGQAVANPEVGADYSATTGSVTISSFDSSSPTVLRSVTVRCPVAGFTIAHADALFGISLTTAGVQGNVVYGISRNSAAFDFNHYHLRSEEVTSGFAWNPGAISRFDRCTAGQTATYRFVAYLNFGVTASSSAWQPKLSVVGYRDRY